MCRKRRVKRACPRPRRPNQGRSTPENDENSLHKPSRSDRTRRGQPPPAGALNDDYIRGWFRWRKAIDEAEAGDTSGIIKLLSFGESIPSESQLLLADLLERHQLKKKRGAQSRPSYEFTPEERKLIRAAYLVRERQRAGAKLESAVDDVAHARNIDPQKLSNFMQGRGSRRSRRFKI